jgi:PAS domain S-box-containing protein
MYRLMIVDDEVIVSTQLKDLVKSMGYKVVGVVPSGEEALALAEKKRPDLVLMNIALPGAMDGFDAAEAICELFDTIILFITTYPDKSLRKRIKKLDAGGYILKPFQSEQVQDAIEIALYKDSTTKQLKASTQDFQTLAKITSDGVLVTSASGRHVWTNPQAAKLTGHTVDELMQITILELVHPKQARKELKRYRGLLKGKETETTYEMIFMKKSRQQFPVAVTLLKSYWSEKPAVITIFKDIDIQKKLEKKLKNAHTEVDQRVRKLTKDLSDRTSSLEEFNIALKMLMKKRNEDKTQMEEKILLNIKQIALPYLVKLKTTGLDTLQLSLANILEANLVEIISPFAHTLSSKYFHLTPTEIFIANLVKQGKSTKDISDSLDMSAKTVESHRKNIRRKLGLTNRGANLRTHLLSLP